MEILLEQLFNGLSLASVLLLIALGLTFTFGQMGVINMAHGELIMAGAFTPYVLQTGVGAFAGAAGAAFAVSLPLAFLVAGLMGVAMERLVIRRMYGRPLDTLLVTFGISLILQQAGKDLFGAPNVAVRAPSWLRGNVDVAGFTMPYSRLFIVALAAVVMGLIWVYMAKLPQGRRMRAVMQNRELAAASGLGTGRVDTLTFFVGSGLAGVAGVAVTLIGSIGFRIGSSYIIDAFLVVIVGGLGKLRGAVLAALALGIVSSYSEYATSASLGKAIVFACVVAFLQFRPNGLVSFRTRG
ncbi:MAG TPA: urea ABC transporter permease subunit UrtB, partial [Acidimicrobiales bacterium]|nr:urea ABC transporter permease subunit UrtB [Acidimicrobiales bacterium]